VTSFALAVALQTSTALQVLCAGAASSAVSAIAEQFHKSSGRDVVVQTGTAGQIEKRITSGEAADIVIVSAQALKTLDDENLLVQGSQTNLGRTGMGVGVRIGAPHPDLSSTAAFKRTLMQAHRIAMSDPAQGASSGIYFQSLLQKLNLSDEIIPKAIGVHGGPACRLVAEGKADLCVQNISEIRTVSGVDFAGAFPEAIQNYITYSAAILKRAASPDVATTFVHALAAPENTTLWRNAGFAAAH
jgi:molybdate transport system substrate-binding protein